MTTERIKRLLACLPDSGLPADLQAWLTDLFSYDPASIDLGERDALIRTIIALCPGSSETASCSYFLECIDGCREHPSATAQNLLVKLRKSGTHIPHSVKQLKRILKHRRQDGWRTWLCPSITFGNDGENTEGGTTQCAIKKQSTR